MSAISRLAKCVVLILLFSVTMTALEPNPIGTYDARLQSVVDGAVTAALTEFAGKKLQSNQIAITLVDLRDANALKHASYRGNQRIYPASVVKTFYLAAACRWLEDGKLSDTPELRRALKDMIVDSSNDATAYVMDVLSGTTAGPELSENEMKVWGEKRNAVNRYFESLGYTNINANQKTWGEGPYGRERVWVGKNYENRNMLTTDATARLFTEIVHGRCVTARRSAEMLALHARDFTVVSNDADNQATGYTALGLPRDSRLWSKAGWTSTARHDAAYVELADGRKFVLVVFTTGHANERGIIAAVAKHIVKSL